MYCYIIIRADGWVYNHKRSFEPQSDKTTPIIYRLKQHASTAVTNLASEEWQQEQYKLPRNERNVWWSQLSENEQEELKANYRIARCRLVEEPE